jgi:hypothetical protein
MNTAELALKVDAFKALRDKRLELQKEVDVIESHEKALRAELVELLRESGAASIGGKVATISLTHKLVPVCEDWDKLYDYVRNTGAFELLHRRLADKAVRERWDAGVQLPGVNGLNVYDISVRKA